MGDSLETKDGVLILARIGDLSIDRLRDGQVMLSTTALNGDVAGTLLDDDQVRRVVHALQCSLTPYGGTDAH